ncbi:MAG: alpha/beta hydrolase [Alphaproteobacteria bacterium]|nr:alpha/beta hydrolase [Alphaproteobacteria bacterium]
MRPYLTDEATMQNHNPWDPQTYASAAIDAETRELNQSIIKAMSAARPGHELTPEESRAGRARGRGPMGPIVYSEMAKTRTIASPAGPLTLRTFTPQKVEGIYFHIHGGGWVVGSADGQDMLLESIAKNCNLAVVSVEYRLAPEHPYPAGPDDCEAAALWVTQNAKREYGSERIFIGGESAGGHLSAVTIMRMRDRHGYTGFAGANLVYGVFDLGLTPSAANWGTEPLILPTPTMQWCIDHFVTRDKVRLPDVSPLYADASNLPPALFTVGTQDLLRDDTLFMYARWIAGGNKAELAVYPGGPHGFTLLQTQLAKDGRARCEAFLRG